MRNLDFHKATINAVFVTVISLNLLNSHKSCTFWESTIEEAMEIDFIITADNTHVRDPFLLHQDFVN